MKSLTFSRLICALNRGATKPIFCSKVAQKGKICSRLLEPQKFVPNAKVAELNRERPTTGNPDSVIVPQYGSSKITVFVWGKNAILKFLENTK